MVSGTMLKLRTMYFILPEFTLTLHWNVVAVSTCCQSSVADPSVAGPSWGGLNFPQESRIPFSILDWHLWWSPWWNAVALHFMPLQSGIPCNTVSEF